MRNRIAKTSVALFLLYQSLFGCACIPSISCAPVKASMGATTSALLNYIKKFDNEAFTEQFAKRTLHQLYMAKKKKQEIARSYERRKVLLKEMNILNQEEAFLNEAITKIPYIEVKALKTKANGLLTELQTIDASIDVANDIDDKMLKLKDTQNMR